MDKAYSQSYQGDIHQTKATYYEWHPRRDGLYRLGWFVLIALMCMSTYILLSAL